MAFVIILAGILFKITPKTLLEKDPDRGVYLDFGKTDESSSFEYTVDKILNNFSRLNSIVIFSCKILLKLKCFSPRSTNDSFGINSKLLCSDVNAVFDLFFS